VFLVRTMGLLTLLHIPTIFVIPHPHYLISIAPYILLAIFCCCDFLVGKNASKLLLTLFYILLFLPAIALPKFYLKNVFELKEGSQVFDFNREHQLASIVRCFSEQGANRVWVAVDPLLYYLSDTESGFGYGFSSARDISSRVRHAEDQIDVIVFSKVPEQFILQALIALAGNEFEIVFDSRNELQSIKLDDAVFVHRLMRRGIKSGRDLVLAKKAFLNPGARKECIRP
jgi:hypothetical protein